MKVAIVLVTRAWDCCSPLQFAVGLSAARWNHFNLPSCYQDMSTLLKGGSLVAMTI